MPLGNDRERGYALVMVLFMILLLTILGTAVVSSTLGGATRAETRESDVQSLHLAEKTLSEAASYLVTKYDGREDIAPEELSVLMNNAVIELKKRDTKSSFQGASGKITDITMEQVNIGDQTSYKLNLTAEAEVNKVKRKLTQLITIGAYPDFLNYAFGSENDVIINGAAYGLGNIYAGHEFLISNTAKYVYNNDPDKKKETKYPYFEGDIFIQNMDSIKVLDISGKYQPYSRTNLTLQQLLGVENKNIQLRDQQKFISINVAESFIDKAEEATKVNRSDIKSAVDSGIANSGTTGSFNSLVSLLKAGSGVQYTEGPPPKPTLPTDLDDEALMADYDKKLADYEAYFVHFNSLSSTVMFNGNLALDGIDYKNMIYTDDAKKNQHKWLIVNGDLTISNYSSDPLVVKANILVTGNVFISDSVKVDSTIFTLGSTTIEDAQIQGIQNNGDRQQLIMISKGPVLVNKVDSFNDFGTYSPNKPNILDAFFYTDQDAELYGVGSIFWLRGGFFSKGDLTINAVLGKASEGDSDIIFDPRPQNSLTKEDSRFIINYDYDLFENQYEGLPRVKKLSVIVGKKQLVASNS
ncbi:hypothetical protein [Paenibacillus glycanilyticus]|uniref:Type 4 fimbrial biogenesis protein PilX N-terminal domain-containing protein n=1 Tax=Paenibacillus glycanilyticus TaxID=126569 RepID=A0ABQ6GJ24_9BACL|nr:hypothetical protein [Paenibacillus glycanilyticus]GLX69296.1 hypothetical protein MU1_36410 [Paenibacillus glycanilyticus]